MESGLGGARVGKSSDGGAIGGARGGRGYAPRGVLNTGGVTGLLNRDLLT